MVNAVSLVGISLCISRPQGCFHYTCPPLCSLSFTTFGTLDMITWSLLTWSSWILPWKRDPPIAVSRNIVQTGPSSLGTRKPRPKGTCMSCTCCPPYNPVHSFPSPWIAFLPTTWWASNISCSLAEPVGPPVFQWPSVQPFVMPLPPQQQASVSPLAVWIPGGHGSSFYLQGLKQWLRKGDTCWINEIALK